MSTTSPYIVSCCIVDGEARPTTTGRGASVQHELLYVNLLAPLHRLNDLSSLSLAQVTPCAVPARLLLLLAEAAGPELVASTGVAEKVEAEHKDGQAGGDRD